MQPPKNTRKPTPPKTDNVANISSKIAEKINDFSKLSAEDRANFLLENIAENMPSDEALQKMAAFTAKARYIAYKAHIDAGFSEEQAMTFAAVSGK